MLNIIAFTFHLFTINSAKVVTVRAKVVCVCVCACVCVCVQACVSICIMVGIKGIIFII